MSQSKFYNKTSCIVGSRHSDTPKHTLIIGVRKDEAAALADNINQMIRNAYVIFAVHLPPIRTSQMALPVIIFPFRSSFGFNERF